MGTGVAQVSGLRHVRPRSRRRSRQALVAGRIAVPAVGVLVWIAAASASSLVPSVGATATAMIQALGDGWIYSPLASTIQAVVIGVVIAAVAGLLLGFAFALHRFTREVLDPLFAAAFAVPRIVIYPVLLIIFGVGLEAKVGMAALSAFFPIVMSTAAGVRNVDPTVVKVGRAAGCSASQLVRKIYIPAALPSVMAGLRIGMSVAFISVIVAEFFAATDGLGQEVSRAYALQELPEMFALVAVIGGIAVGANVLLWLVERRVRTGVA